MEKKEFLSKVILFLAVLMAGTLLSITVQANPAFWFGGNISDNISPSQSQALHDSLAEFSSSVLETAMGDAGNNPDGMMGTRIWEQDETWDGYTLLSIMGGFFGGGSAPAGVLIDMDGSVVRTWPMLATWGVPVKMLPNGDIMGGAPPNIGIMDIPGMGFFTGFEGHLTQFDWCGNPVGRSGLEPTGNGHWGEHQHHDNQRWPNPVGYYAPGLDAETRSGTTMWLDHIVEDLANTSHINPTTPLADDVVYIADWEGNIEFEWHASQHFSEEDCRDNPADPATRRPGCLSMGFDDAAKNGIMNENNTPWFVLPMPNLDWTHGNNAAWVGPNKWMEDGHDLRFHEENIMVDFRSMNISIIIARYDNPNGDWKSGDIVWRIGPDYSPGHPEHKLGQIIGQHHFHNIPKGLPGAGNFMLFDNGGMAGYGALIQGLTDADGNPIGVYPNTFRNYSRVIEFNPITLDLVWEYKDPVREGDVNLDGEVKGDERKFFSTYTSSAQRLKNGNTMISEGGNARVFEVTKEGKIVWEYILDSSDPAIGGGGGYYRAYRVPYKYAPKNMECPAP